MKNSKQTNIQGFYGGYQPIQTDTEMSQSITPEGFISSY